MPIYDYECQDCKTQFEVEAKMSDPPPPYCPNCKHPHIRRMISRTSFVLKGGGWYVTDYKSKRKDESKTDSVDKPAATAVSKSDAIPSNTSAPTTADATNATAAPTTSTNASSSAAKKASD